MRRMIKRIKVFLSSVIKECEEERKRLASIFKELNHDCFIFEDEGASPHPPRRLYLQHLRGSQIFVAIYKNSYGYVAKDMEISGIEDEYREASKIGIPKFIYIYAEDQNREKPLKLLIDEIGKESEVTYYKFSEIDDLVEKIKGNITNHIAEVYGASVALETLERATPKDQFEYSLKGLNFVKREDMLQGIYSGFERRLPINLYGPAGIGKTTLLLKLADEKKFIYIPAKYLTPRESLLRIVNDLNEKHVVGKIPSNDFEGLSVELKRLWLDIKDITIIIDDIEDSPELIKLASELNELSQGNKIILSSRNKLEGKFTALKMTYLSSAQIEDAINKTLTDAESQTYEKAYRRNPEIIKHIKSILSGDFTEGSISTETLWNKSSGLAGELLTFIWMSGSPLSIENLEELTNKKGIESQELWSALEEVKFLLKDTIIGYEIASESIRGELQNIIEKSPAKLIYYSKKIAKWFFDRGDYISSYKALKNTGDPRLPKILRHAARQAGIEWKQKDLKAILSDQVLYFEKSDDKENLILALLAYAQSEEYVGDFESAQNAIDKAREINAELNKEDNFDNEIKERTLLHEALLSRDEVALQKLEDLIDYYLKNEDKYSAARIGIELCVLKMNQKDYDGARPYAEEALITFQQLGDNYGINVAKRNLVMIMHYLPQFKEDGDRILKELTEGELVNKRERAWLCNLMTVKFRKKYTKKGYEIAEEYAQEAINIGKELDDPYLISNNLINLGNVYFDKEEYEKAIESYNKAAEIAQNIQRKDIEASASVQLATVYNVQGEYVLAKNYALHGAALAASVLGRIERGQALNQYAKACQRLGENTEACEKSLEAALEVKSLDYKVSQSYIDRAVMLAHATKNMDLYLETLEKYYLSGDKIPDDLRAPCEKLHHLTANVICGTLEEYIIPIFGIHTYFLLDGLPPLIQRQLFKKTLEHLVSLKKDGLKSELFFHSLFSLLVAISPDVLISDDLIDVGDLLNDNFEGITFKPEPDGAIRFCLNLELGKTLTVSFITYDNRKDSQVVCLLLVLFLMGFQNKIRSEIIMEFEFERDELEIAISSIEETPGDLKPFFQDALKDEFCAVPRPVSPKEDRNIPLFVVCRGDISQNWKTATGSVTSIQWLVANILSELTYRLYENEVELDSIMPKIINIVKETIS